ncbi:MAG: E3 binding domain-containing protein, partial [Gammaproteobacteria bacterium]|nr:E3 binding domain-containing protein [Gammaproteobacteria bacterium]
MTIEIRVPQLPESVADATLVAWRKQPGETAGRDENLADLETDKVVLEVPAPANGVLKEILVQAGTTVKSGDLLAVYEPGASAAAAAPAAKPAAAARAAAPAAAPAGGEAARLSPAVRRLVEENKLDPAQISGSGKDGRLTKGDVVSHLGKQGASAQAPAAKPAATPAPAAAPLPAGARSEQRVPMTRLRQRIAERLVRAQAEAALLTTFNEIDLTAINELRARYKDRF